MDLQAIAVHVGFFEYHVELAQLNSSVSNEIGIERRFEGVGPKRLDEASLSC